MAKTPPAQALVAGLQRSNDSAATLAPGFMIPFPGGFKIWSQGIVRSGGFPLADLLQLGDPDYAAAVDRWLDIPDDTSAAAMHAAAATAARRQAALLAVIARRPDLQEAVTWQNPDLVEPMIVGLGRTDADSPQNKKLRKKQRIVLKYWARYCAKNETIGFFGPGCWFGFRKDGEALRMTPGSEVVRRGEVFIEPWAVDALAASLAAAPDVRPWIAPRRHPTVHRTGDTVLTLGGPVQLDPAEAALLDLVDGTRAARDIVEKIDGGYEAIEALVAKGLICWDLEPPMVQRAERVLRERLQEIGDPAVCDRAVAAVDRLTAARDALAGCTTAEELNAKVVEVERVFTELTGVDPLRRPGQAYGGRRLVYLECERDLEVSFGPQVLESFAAALSLLLESSRWFAHEAAERLRAVLSVAFDAMGRERVGFNELCFSVADQVFIPGNRPLDHLIVEFAENWRKLLGLDTDANLVAHTSKALRDQVAGVFGGARPSWAFAWMHSVDLMIGAPGREGFERREIRPVIGEIHTTYCPFEIPVFGNTHPDQEELRNLLDSVIPDGRVMLSPVKDHPRVTARTYPWLNEDRDWRLCVSAYPPRGPERQLPLCGLEVRRGEDGRLLVGLPDAAESFDVVDICGAWMMYEMLDVLKHVVRGYAHSPRVTIDDLVVFRESWSFPIAGLDWISTRTDAEHFVGARRWLREAGLPELVFASISSETKPLFVDFRSEVQVGNLAQLLRTAAETEGASVTFSEMMPGPEELWLADAEGNRYTSELRLQFIDASA